MLFLISADNKLMTKKDYKIIAEALKTTFDRLGNNLVGSYVKNTIILILS